MKSIVIAFIGGLLLGSIGIRLACAPSQPGLVHSGDSLDVSVETFAETLHVLKVDTVFVTTTVREADAHRRSAEEHEARGDTVAAGVDWKAAYLAERNARVFLQQRVNLYADSLIPRLESQVREAQRQRDQWRKVSEKSEGLFGFMPYVGGVKLPSGSWHPQVGVRRGWLAVSVAF